MWLVCVAILLLAWWRKGRLDEKIAAAKAAVEERKRKRKPRPVAASATLGAVYAGFSAWTFVAWYRKHAPLSEYKWGGDGWMGVGTYAGGADKCGHAWATMTLARLGTFILAEWGGFSRRKVSIISALLSEMLFTGVEVKDGVYYEFSFSDLTGDSIGMVMALLLDNFPKLREAFAYRVEYRPSEMYKRIVFDQSQVAGFSRWNIAEDYSGQTYLAAFHPSAIKALRDALGPLSRFFDVALGFGSHNYKPSPDKDLAGERPHQDLSLRLSVNLKGIADEVLENRRSAVARGGRLILDGLFEVFNLPYGSVALATTSREKPPPQWKNGVAVPVESSNSRRSRGRVRARPAPRSR
jgi:hypothetical protein